MKWVLFALEGAGVGGLPVLAAVPVSFEPWNCSEGWPGPCCHGTSELLKSQFVESTWTRSCALLLSSSGAFEACSLQAGQGKLPLRTQSKAVSAPGFHPESLL